MKQVRMLLGTGSMGPAHTSLCKAWPLVPCSVVPAGPSSGCSLYARGRCTHEVCCGLGVQRDTPTLMQLGYSAVLTLPVPLFLPCAGASCRCKRRPWLKRSAGRAHPGGALGSTPGHQGLPGSRYVQFWPLASQHGGVPGSRCDSVWPPSVPPLCLSLLTWAGRPSQVS